MFPGLLQRAGASWRQPVSHPYLTSPGICGVAVGVVDTYAFHFVLFGVMAKHIGLGQLFLDVACSIAGGCAGVPAKVSVFGSAMFGMLSGSSVAHAVTVAPLTIPAMMRVGCRREFAAAVAFLMIDFLAVLHQTLIVAVTVTAFMHFSACSCRCISRPSDLACGAGPRTRCSGYAGCCASAGPR